MLRTPRAGRFAAALLAGLVLPLTGQPVVAEPAGPRDASPDTSSGASAGSKTPRPARVLERRLHRVVKAGGVGAVAEVVNPRRTWRLADGRATVDPRRAAKPGARFRAGSVTKQLVAVVALQLVAKGRWSLGTTIGDVLPGLWPERSDLTLRQLLSHTSGMPDYIVPLIAEAETTPEFLRAISRKRTPRALVRAAKGQPWVFEPGTDWDYSNTGYVVVGLMLRMATGKDLPRLVHNRVLRPAGMTQSKLARTPRVGWPRLHEYARLEGLQDLGRSHPSMFDAAGALVSTTRDLNRFHEALSRGDLLPPGLVRTMRSVVVVDEESGLPYGLGSYRLPDPCRPGEFVHGHDGATWGTYTWSFSSPDGRRRVTVAATGRAIDRSGRPIQQVFRFVDAAFAATCPGGPPRSAAGGRQGVEPWPAPPDARVAR